MDRIRFEDLAERHLKKSLTSIEKEEFIIYLDQKASNEELHFVIEKAFTLEFTVELFVDTHRQKMIDAILDRTSKAPMSSEIVTKFFSGNPYSILKIAAMVAVVFSLVFFFSYNKKTSFLEKPVAVVQDISPGSNRAFLMLANGSKIDLAKAKGRIATQNGIEIRKTRSEGLTYSEVWNVNVEKTDQIFINIINTPRGGQYNVVLQDGTKVWLNSESSLRFPVSFTGKERRVEITGEAYFEVAKNKMKPFIIQSGKQNIRVLGTRFNINTYHMDAMETTLFEGLVQVVTESGSKAFLRPGQKSIVNNYRNDKSITVSAADLEIAISWKKGLFMFKNQKLEVIMEMVARWYNVDVIYLNSNVKTVVFSGTLSKFENISQLLEVLGASGSVNFKMQGRRLLVM